MHRGGRASESCDVLCGDLSGQGVEARVTIRNEGVEDWRAGDLRVQTQNLSQASGSAFGSRPLRGLAANFGILQHAIARCYMMPSPIQSVAAPAEKTHHCCGFVQHPLS